MVLTNQCAFCFLLTMDTESVPIWQRMQHQFTGESQKGERARPQAWQRWPRPWDPLPWSRTPRTRFARRRYQGSRNRRSMRSCEGGRDAAREAHVRRGARSGSRSCLHARRSWSMQACKHAAPPLLYSVYMFVSLFFVFWKRDVRYSNEDTQNLTFYKTYAVVISIQKLWLTCDLSVYSHLSSNFTCFREPIGFRSHYHVLCNIF